MAAIAEIEADLAEVRELLAKAKRPNVRALLEKNASTLSETKKQLYDKAQTGASTSASVSNIPLPLLKVTNYGWDQSDNYVKIYITLNNVHTVPAENVHSEFGSKGFKLIVSNLAGKNHIFEIHELQYEIAPATSLAKVKPNMVLIMLKKAEIGKQWDDVTKAGAASKQPKLPKFDEAGDPKDSIMDMMKQMYDDGDDEMKRTIRKAWTQSREGKTDFAGMEP